MLPSAFDDPLIGLVLDGRYRIIEVAGSGGMSTVYRAEQTNVIGRDVAVKVLSASLIESDDAIRRFENEARVVAKLRHPNTLKVHDLGRLEDERLYIVTEFLHGHTLETALRRGALPCDRTLRIARQVIASVIEAHEHGIVHRDLKPGNIFLEVVGSAEIARVVDFGLAKLITGPSLTSPGDLFGTPGYMSPEQIWGERVDHRTDIYALGAVMYACLAGQAPFTANSVAELLAKHTMHQPPPLSSIAAVDPELEEMVMAMLAKSPSARPRTLLEVDQVLASVERRLTFAFGLSDTMPDLDRTHPADPAEPETTRSLRPGENPTLRTGLGVNTTLLIPQVRTEPLSALPNASTEPAGTGGNAARGSAARGNAARINGPPRWLAAASIGVLIGLLLLLALAGHSGSLP